MKVEVVLLYLCSNLLFSWSSSSTLLKEKQVDVYKHYSFEDICRTDGTKRQLFIGTDVSIFTFNSSTLLEPIFKCHVELEVQNSNYGFSVFIEEMTLSGTVSGCEDDYLQFGRDILFVTSHRSIKYCGDIEPPVPTSSQGLTGFDFPYTPLVRRIYTEELDKDMDVWLRISTAESWSKSLTLVVTPFKKFCGSQDLQYRQCRYSTKCVRRELFCDGRVNCAWPYAEPADEVYCKDISSRNNSVWRSSNIPVIIIVSIVILGAISLLCLGLAKLTSKVKKFNDYYSSEQQGCLAEPDTNIRRVSQEFNPSCPPPPPVPLPPHPLLRPEHRLPTPSAPCLPSLHPLYPPPPLHPGGSLHPVYQHPPPPYSPPRGTEEPPSYSAIAYQHQ